MLMHDAIGAKWSFGHAKGKNLSVSKPSSRVKLTFLIQAPIHLKFQEMKLQKKEVTSMKKFE